MTVREIMDLIWDIFYAFFAISFQVGEYTVTIFQFVIFCMVVYLALSLFFGLMRKGD